MSKKYVNTTKIIGNKYTNKSQITNKYGKLKV